MPKLLDLAKMTVSGSPGTASLTLNAAVSGWLSFSAAGVSDGDSVYYCIQDGANSELGIGTYTASGTALSRDKVLASTNSAAKIAASSAAIVFVTAPAELLQPSAPTVLTDAATVNIDGTLGPDYKLTFTTHGGIRTLANPSPAMSPGQRGYIWVYQDSTGGEGLQTGSNWLTPNGILALSGSASALDLLEYKVLDSGDIALWVAAANVKYAPAVTVNYLGNYDPTSGLASFTITAAGLGTASADRYILATVNARTPQNVSSVSIGGVAATKLVQAANSGWPGVSSIWIAHVPTGATGDVAVVLSANPAGVEVALWELHNLQNAGAAESTASDNTKATYASTLATVSVGSAQFATANQNGAGAQTLSGVTADFSNFGASSCASVAGHKTSPTANNGMAVGATVQNINSCFCAVSLR